MTKQVFIQVNFVKVGEVNTQKECFDAEVMIKSRWREPTLDSQAGNQTQAQLQNLWNPKIYISNAIGAPNTKVDLSVERNENNESYVVERKKFRGSFIQIMNLQFFPFDIQELSILIKSDAAADDLAELVDEPAELHKVNKRSFIDEQEFYLYKYVVTGPPPVNPDRGFSFARRKKSSLQATIVVARRWVYFFWNVFFLQGVIVALSLTSFEIDSNLYLPNRLQLCFILVLTNVTLKNFINAHVPKIHYLTYVDNYVLLMIVLLEFISIWHGVMTRLPVEYREHADELGACGFITVFVYIHFGFIASIRYKAFELRREMKRKEVAYEAEHVKSHISSPLPIASPQLVALQPIASPQPTA